MSRRGHVTCPLFFPTQCLNFGCDYRGGEEGRETTHLSRAMATRWRMDAVPRKQKEANQDSEDDFNPISLLPWMVSKT